MQWLPSTHIFAVVTWGCAATTWLTHVLNSHPDIFCVHAANNVWSTFGGVPRLEGLDYLRVIGAQGHFCKAAGDVHGVSLESVPQLRAVLGDLFSCAIVIREPMARLRSQMGMFAHSGGSRHWNVDYLDSLFPDLKLPDRRYETRLFVHGANMLNRITLERRVAPVYRSEDLTSDPVILKAFAESMTAGKVEVTEQWAQDAIQRPRVNHHKASGHSVEPLADWQIDVIRAVVTEEAWRDYRELGYEAPEFETVRR